MRGEMVSRNEGECMPFPDQFLTYFCGHDFFISLLIMHLRKKIHAGEIFLNFWGPRGLGLET
jgi:hypothetical protein